MTGYYHRMWLANGTDILIGDNNVESFVSFENVLPARLLPSNMIMTLRDIKASFKTNNKQQSISNNQDAKSKSEMYEMSKVMYVEPANKDVNFDSLCFYKSSEGNYEYAPILEVSGKKCPSGSNNDIYIERVRSVTNIDGKDTINNYNGKPCDIKRSNIFDTKTAYALMGDCSKPSSVFKEDPYGAVKYANKYQRVNMKKYFPDLKFTSKIRSDIETRGPLPVAVNSKLSVDEVSKYSGDGCFKTTDDGIYFKVEGKKCPENKYSQSFYNVNPEKITVVDKNGNARILDNFQKCEYDLLGKDKALKAKIGGDCSTAPTDWIKRNPNEWSREFSEAKSKAFKQDEQAIRKSLTSNMETRPGLNGMPVYKRQPPKQYCPPDRVKVVGKNNPQQVFYDPSTKKEIKGCMLRNVKLDYDPEHSKNTNPFYELGGSQNQ